MAKRFYSEFNNPRNEHFTVEIHDTEFVGTATLFDTAEEGFLISPKGEGQERTGTVLPTECAVRFRIVTADDEDFLQEIITSKEGRFTIKITKGTGSPTLFWVGLVVPDVGSYEEAYRPFFTLKAVDGLGMLREIPYKDGGSLYSGRETLKQQLVNCLARLSYVDTHFATSERFLRIAVDWWETTMTNSSTNDPLALTWVNQAVWYEYKKSVVDVVSCYDVIDNIMRCFGARITQHEGVFWVEQITYRTASTIVLRSYDKAGTYISSNNFSTQNTINQTGSGALESGGVYEFFGPLMEARHVFEVNLRQNLLAGYAFSNSNTSDTVNRPVEANSGATTLWLTANVSLNIVNPSFTGGALVQPGFAIFRCQLKIGTRWLENDYAVQNYQVNFGSFVWETVNSYFYVAVALPNGLPPPQTFAPGVSYTYNQVLNLMTPQLPAGAQSFDFSMELWEYSQGVALVNFTSTWNMPEPWLEPFSYGNPALNDDEWEYVTESPDVENTLKHERKCLIGSSTDPNAVGSLWVKPSSTFILATDWGDGTDTPDREIEKLNVELVLGGQQRPIRRLSGNLRGELSLMGRVLWDGAVWLLLGGTYNGGLGEMNGEWWELDYDGAGLSTSGPIKVKVKGKSDFPIFTGGGVNDSGKVAYNLSTAGPGTLLYPVAVARTADEITAGVISQIDITTTLEDGDFTAGDIVALLNPVTGIFEDIDVTVTSVAGQDFITVLGTLTGNYPPDSPVIKKAKLSTYELPPGDTGEILRHTGLRWRAYAGVTDGHVLTWDSVNGWQAEAPASGSGTVTSVALTMPSAIFDVAGSPITTSGTLAVTLDNQGANTVFSGPTTGGAAAPTFRALVAADIPNLDFSKITTGVVPVAQGGTGLSALGSALQLIRVNAGATALEYFTHSFLTANQTITLSGDVTGSGSTAITTTIANDAVTFAKMQNITTARLLGRATAGTGDVEQLTLGATLAFSGTAVQTVAMTGDVTTAANSFATSVVRIQGRNVASTAPSDLQLLGYNGSTLQWEPMTGAILVVGGLTAGRMIFAAGSNVLDDDAAVTWDNTNKRMQIGVGGTLSAYLNLMTSTALTSATEFLRVAASNTSNNLVTFLNSNNANTAAHMILTLSSGGAAGGDALIQFVVSGVGQTAIGVDNSDGDKFKITPGASVPGGTANRGLVVTNGATANVGVNIDIPLQPLHVNGRARAAQWVQTQQNPTVAFGAGAGTGPSGSATGGPNSFQISFTTGTAPTANGLVFTVTLGTAYPVAHHFVFSARNAQAATDVGKFYISAFSTTQITVTANGTLAASTQYIFNFVGCGY